MKTDYFFIANFPRTVLNMDVDNVECVNVTSKMFDSLSDVMTIALDLAQQMSREVNPKNDVHLFVHPSPFIRNQFNSELIATEEDIEYFGLDDLEFSHGELLHLWLFEESEEQPSINDAITLIRIFSKPSKMMVQ